MKIFLVAQKSITKTCSQFTSALLYYYIFDGSLVCFTTQYISSKLSTRSIFPIGLFFII